VLRAESSREKVEAAAALSTASVKHATLTGEVSRLAAELSVVTNKFETLSRSSADAAVNLANVRVKASKEVNTAANEFTEKRETLETRGRQLREEIHTASVRNATLTTEVSRLTAEVAAVTGKFESVSRLSSQAAASLAKNLDAARVKARKEVDSVTKRLIKRQEVLQATERKLREDISASSVKNATLTAEITRLILEVDAVETRFEEASRSSAEATAHLAEARVRATKEVDTVTKVFAEQREVLEAMEKHLREEITAAAVVEEQSRAQRDALEQENARAEETLASSRQAWEKETQLLKERLGDAETAATNAKGAG
jgi:chromosome segregation ATPase